MIEVKVSAYIDKNTASAFNAGKDTVDDILILHLENGKDYYISFDTISRVERERRERDYIIFSIQTFIFLEKHILQRFEFQQCLQTCPQWQDRRKQQHKFGFINFYFILNHTLLHITYTGWPMKNRTSYFPQYVDAITGISVCHWGNFSWEKWYQDTPNFPFSA